MPAVAPFLSDVDLFYNQIKRTRLENLTVDPSGLSAGLAGVIEFRTDLKVAKIWNGTAFDQLTGNVSNIVGTTASGTVQGVTAATTATGTGRSDQTITISTTAATAGQAGSMSASDFTKLGNATATNTANTLVLRDGSGNFAAGVITASLTGTASNATNLNGQAATYYLDRTNHTGTQLASTISNFDTQVRTSRLDQMAAPTAPVAYNAQRITGLADPTGAQDGATKNYVDNIASGLDIRASVRWATTANITLGGLQAVDGATVVAAGDRVLVKNQTTASGNGIYVAASGAWTRATDAATSAQVTAGLFTFVEEGATQADTGWVLQTDNPITLGTTALAFTQFTGGAAYTAGNGLTQNGNVFSVVGTANKISVSGAGVDIAATYAGQGSIITVSNTTGITTGVWNATAIDVAHGGTGATTAAGAKTNLGYMTRVVATFTGNGGNSYPVLHNLGTVNHSVTVTDATGVVSYFGVTVGANTDTFDTGQPLASGTYTVTVIG